MNGNVTKTNLRYFASANGGGGFVSYFDKVFDPARFDRIFILKGGPGTGKSTLMRKAKDVATELCAYTEEILCSSDPDSLDGIIIKTNTQTVAILDGTAPHTRDPLIPGAVDELVDLGCFWNNKLLSEKTESIKNLQKLKKQYYESAYTVLSAARSYKALKNALLLECIEKPKLERSIARLFDVPAIRENEPTTRYMLTNAISAKGPYNCKTYESAFEKSIPVYGPHGASFAVINEIKRFADKNKISSVVSPTPLIENEHDAIYLPKAELSFFVAGKYKHAEHTKPINSERFINKDLLAKAKPTLSVLTRLYNDAMKSAYELLAKTRTYHFDLEKIYTEAMDFERMTYITEKITSVIKASCI